MWKRKAMRALRKNTRKGTPIRRWVRRARRTQRGGFLVTGLVALGTALAPYLTAGATGAITSASAYGTTKLLKKAENFNKGERKVRRQARRQARRVRRSRG